jgi:phosphatidylserine decarboxylase
MIDCLLICKGLNLFCNLRNLAGAFSQVNPIAVNSKYCNVFTENKRDVNIIESKEFGKVY